MIKDPKPEPVPDPYLILTDPDGPKHTDHTDPDQAKNPDPQQCIELCLNFPAIGVNKLEKNERNGETRLSHKGFLATVIFFESADPFTACKYHTTCLTGCLTCG
jgi:hypothetical protein